MLSAIQFPEDPFAPKPKDGKIRYQDIVFDKFDKNPFSDLSDEPKIWEPTGVPEHMKWGFRKYYFAKQEDIDKGESILLRPVYPEQHPNWEKERDEARKENLRLMAEEKREREEMSQEDKEIHRVVESEGEEEDETDGTGGNDGKGTANKAVEEEGEQKVLQVEGKIASERKDKVGQWDSGGMWEGKLLQDFQHENVGDKCGDGEIAWTTMSNVVTSVDPCDDLSDRLNLRVRVKDGAVAAAVAAAIAASSSGEPNTNSSFRRSRRRSSFPSSEEDVKRCLLDLKGEQSEAVPK